MSITTHLQARIEAVNKANNILNEKFPVILELLKKEFTDKKVYLATGSKSKKFKDFVDKLDLPCNGFLYIHLDNSWDQLYFKVRVNVFFNETDNVGYESSEFIGYMKDGVINFSERPFKPFKTDYSEREILDARERIDELEKQISEIKHSSGIHLFNNF